MESLAESMPGQATMPRFEDGSINLRELIRRLAEDVVNAIMDAEADQLCSGGANSRNGYRERNLATCVGDITLRIPKLRSGSFFPEDVVERYQRVDRAVVAAVAETYATGTSTRKVQRVAEKLGISRLSKDRVSAIAQNLDADANELLGRDLGESRTPYLWLDATYVKCRRGGRVASTAFVIAIGSVTKAAGTACWACPSWTPSRATRGPDSCAPSGTEASMGSSSSPRTPTRAWSGPSMRCSRARRGSAAPCT